MKQVKSFIRLVNNMLTFVKILLLVVMVLVAFFMLFGLIKQCKKIADDKKDAKKEKESAVVTADSAESNSAVNTEAVDDNNVKGE